MPYRKNLSVSDFISVKNRNASWNIGIGYACYYWELGKLTSFIATMGEPPTCNQLENTHCGPMAQKVDSRLGLVTML